MSGTPDLAFVKQLGGRSLVLALMGLMMLTSGKTDARAERDGPRVLQWVLTRGLPPGRPVELRLPPELANASADGLTQVAMLADKRCCVLLKTQIGYKGNFDGALLCSAPLRPEEIALAREPVREYVTLPGQGVFEELYLRRRIDEHRFDVYFDLN